jgi:hypothetical protein
VVQIESAATEPVATSSPAPAAPFRPIAPPAPSSRGRQSTGVPECDDYFDALDACVSKNPAMRAAAAIEQSIETSRNAWKKAAETPAGRAGLKTGCAAAADALKQSCP